MHIPECEITDHIAYKRDKQSINGCFGKWLKFKFFPEKNDAYSIITDR